MEEKKEPIESPDYPLHITDENFDEVIKKYKVIVVDFWAPWCMPCKMLAPAIENLAKKLQGKVVFGKMNVDESPNIPTKFNIMSIPTLIVFKDGSAVGTFVGAMPEHTLEEKILSVIG
ncbi:MAG: thioredoxin [Candidatus Ratteibacteria bacterium]|nr:thioredoxin [Candidatus Ratteibacteria bacterium]